MAKPKITDTSKRTKLEELIEGTPLTREQYKHISVEVLHEWLKRNHKEDKETWLSLLENEQEIISLFPDKKKTVPVLDEDGKPVMRETKTRKKKDEDGNIIPAKIILVPETKEIPYKAGEKRMLTAFELRDWVCDKYGMSPEKKDTNQTEDIRGTLAQDTDW